MAAKKCAFFVLFLVLCHNVESATIFERSYEYLMSFGKSWAPSFMSILDCMGETEPLTCAKEKAGKLLDSWDQEVQKQRRSWQEAADAEVLSSGRSMEEMPSKIGKQVEDSLNSIADMVGHGVARALARKKHDSGGIDSITISTGGGEKKKMKKKKTKPAKIHLVHPMVMQMKEKGVENRGFGDQSLVEDNRVQSRGFGVQSGVKDKPVQRGFGPVQSWVVGERSVNSSRRGRGLMSDLWDAGEEALDAAAEHALKSDEKEDGVADKSSLEEQRGKKKKKKKAILKLLILGAVLKAKIGTLLQILSFKLQVKFFLIALIGLGINLARLWIDLKNKHSQQPQKVIYYEHAQHQHHYDHETEEHGWGPWSRSISPEETAELEDLPSSPYHAQDRQDVVYRPLLTKD